jgi:hypothetical protein
VVNGAVEIIEAKNVSPTSLQNPADPEAIYNKKNKKESRGYKGSVTETCSEGNDVQLITNVGVYDNNTSDGEVISSEAEELKERTGVEEVVGDGGYVGEGPEKKCEEAGVKLITTKLKGKKANKKFTSSDFEIEDGEVKKCPAGKSPEKNAFSLNGINAHFKKEDCTNCLYKNECSVNECKNFFSLRFDKRRVNLDKRRAEMQSKDFLRYQKLRPPVEGAVSRLKPKRLNGRSLFREKKRIGHRLAYRAIGVNFRRILGLLDLRPFILNFLRRLSGFFRHFHLPFRTA